MKHLKEICDTVYEIIGDGIAIYTTIKITKNTMEIITDELITAEKITKLNKHFKEKNYIEARDNKIVIVYPLPPAE